MVDTRKSGVPHLSVGMPAYNAEPWIAAAIESILDQSFTDFELVISDNGSTDRTPEICQTYAERDPRIRLVCHEINRGAVYNYNYVVSEARAPYFKWASSNDLCHPEFLASCVECLDLDPDVVMAYPASILFSEDPEQGEPYDDDLGLDVADPCARFIRFVERVRLNNVLNGVARREALRAGPPERHFMGSDYIVMAALTLRGRFRFVPRPLYYRRMDAGTATPRKSRREIMAHYDPDGTRRMVFQFWRRRSEYFRVVNASPISLRDKLRLHRELTRSTFGVRARLWNDTIYSMRVLAAAARGMRR